MPAQILNEEELTRTLAYAGFVLVAYELVKSMIVGPIKAFYANTTFGEGLPFKTYEADVLSRHKNELEACLYYLRDFMQVIDAKDVMAIQALRKHRNDLAHDFVSMLHDANIERFLPMLEEANTALFKLSNHHAYMEIGSDPRFKGVDWETHKGQEYLLFEEVLKKVRILRLKFPNP